MKKNILFLYSVFCIVLATQAQDKNFPEIPLDVFEKANTAKEVGYLTDEEKRVIYLVNLARIDGNLFAKTYLAKHIKENKLDASTEALKTLLQDLRSTQSDILLPTEKLSEAACFHADDTGQKGLVQHDSSDGTTFAKRIRRYVKGGAIAENCSYGYETAEGILMQLLIDENIPSRGHRKNILNPTYKFLGVCIRPHARWKFTCVQDFSSLQE